MEVKIHHNGGGFIRKVNPKLPKNVNIYGGGLCGYKLCTGDNDRYLTLDEIVGLVNFYNEHNKEM